VDEGTDTLEGIPKRTVDYVRNGHSFELVCKASISLLHFFDLGRTDGTTRAYLNDEIGTRKKNLGLHTLERDSRSLRAEEQYGIREIRKHPLTATHMHVNIRLNAVKD
jgi:hypothetical protein